MILRFDDGSETDLNLHPDLRKAMATPFHKLDPAKVEILLTAAIDWFWDRRQEPSPYGEAKPWSKTYATKGELGLVVVQRYLHFQVIAEQTGIAKFVLKMQNEETSMAIRGEPAYKRCNEMTRGHLMRYGALSLNEAGMRLLAAGAAAEARETFDGITQLLPEEGTAWFWLGILRRRDGDAEGAAPAFRRAAELLASSYLDRARCPSCGFIPCGQPMWKCEGCGEMVDLFEARGECPKCRKANGDTACPACRAKAPHASWWIA